MNMKMCYNCMLFVNDSHACPRSTAPVPESGAPGVIWNTSGATRGFGGGKKLPKIDQRRNFGHNPVTFRDIGMTNAQAREFTK